MGAVPRRLEGGPLPDGGAGVNHADRGPVRRRAAARCRRRARALGARGAARARRRRRAMPVAAVGGLLLAGAQPPPRQGGDWNEGNSSGEDIPRYAKECGEIEGILRINSVRGLN